MKENLYHENFVVTPKIEELIKRSLIYLKSGFPIHFQGPAGTGKTAIALHIARQLERPIMVMFGNEELERSNFIGNNMGFKRKLLYDNYISSVIKKEEEFQEKWIDGRILHACKNGYTLVYDEFTRSRPETNNVFLSILEEKVIEITSNKTGNEHIQIHPDFRVIFTSNPEEYAGIYKLQDALRDRMITLNIEYPDRETEIEILKAQAQIEERTAETIVEIIRGFRELKKLSYSPTIRSEIMIGKSIKICGLEQELNNELFRQICRDVILSEKSSDWADGEDRKRIETALERTINTVLFNKQQVK